MKRLFLPTSLRSWGLGLLLAGCLVSDNSALADNPPQPTAILTRVFFQDDTSHTLKWADLEAIGTEYRLTAPQTVPGLPTFKDGEQHLVQMRAAQGFLLIGVRDDDEGAVGSGWILVDCGTEIEPHGDHVHWQYPKTPRVRATQIDEHQGNPAHLYCYDDVFYLANDRKQGYTRLDPARITPQDDEAKIRQLAVFHPGGGGHITLAVGQGFGYSAWIDREGDNRGRVDITPIADKNSPKIVRSVNLPTGGIHGGAFVGGKAFFAPADGLAWLSAYNPNLDPTAQISVQQISLGKEGDRPIRTGAFESLGNHLALTTGRGPNAKLWILDAQPSQPKPVSLSIPMDEGNGPSGLRLVRPRRGSPLAMVFHDHPADSTAPNLLSVVELDHDQNGTWDDPKIVEQITVGASQVEGHGGHHSLDFDADRRRAVFSNPGSGTISVLSLADRKILLTTKVGGIPSKLVTVGGRATRH